MVVLLGTDEHLRASRGAGKEDTATEARENKGRALQGGDLGPREYRSSKGPQWNQAEVRGQGSQEGPEKGRKPPAYSFAMLGREQTLVEQTATGRLSVGAMLFSIQVLAIAEMLPPGPCTTHLAAASWELVVISMASWTLR